MPTEPGPEITFSLDLEDHRPSPPTFGPRYADVTSGLLRSLAADGIDGSVFVVGEVAEASPNLVREAAELGFEIGLHAWTHEPLDRLTPGRFRDETRRGKELLERITGADVVGFRAPIFSIVPQSAWVPDVLFDLGFLYSSSVLPAWSPLYGWPTLPEEPFEWPSGLLELPCPITRLGPLGVPYLGGIYLRVLPQAIVERARRRIGSDEVAFTYCHPFDFDPDEPRWVDDYSHATTAGLRWRNRDLMEERVRRVIGAGGRPLRDRATSLSNVLGVDRTGRPDRPQPRGRVRLRR